MGKAPPRTVPSSPVLAARLGWEGVGDGLTAACPPGEPGRAGVEGSRGIFLPPPSFFPSFLVTILQLSYGRSPGLNAAIFKAAVFPACEKK